MKHRPLLPGLVITVLLMPGLAMAQLFTYEDLDPDATSPVSNGLTITGFNFDATRPAVGNVDVGAGTGDFMQLLTAPAQFDVSPFIGKQLSAFAETNIPTGSTMNLGDSVYLQVDFFNDAIGTPTIDDYHRFTAGFFDTSAPADTWLEMAVNPLIPATTPNMNAVDRVEVSVLFTDGGFGGVPNDSGPGTFAYVDNFSVNIFEPDPVFYQDTEPPSGSTDVFGTFLAQQPDPTDPGNTSGLVSLGGAGNFVNVNSGPAVAVEAFEGQKFRAAFDYLIPTDTAFDSNDTFWIQLGLFDPISNNAVFPGTTNIAGGNNSASAGFPDVLAQADGTWRTIELEGVIPPDSDGGAFSIVFTDNGFAGGMPDTFGDVMYIDNLIFEAVDVLPGDFNGDGVVDIADLTVWRDNLGTPAPAPDGMGFYVYGDAINSTGEAPINFAGDGMNGVDQADLMVWMNNFGATSSPPPSAPEPSTFGLGVWLLLAAAARRRLAG